MKTVTLILFIQIASVVSLLPPKFQWKSMDFAWKNARDRENALASGDYVPAHNMPTGLARWKDKVFITIPRWKKGVPSSLNYVSLNGPQSPLLNPYPSWNDGFVMDSAPRASSNATVVSTFRIHVDSCDRLWVVDNGVSDMASGAKQVTEPAVVIFDLKSDTLLQRYIFDNEVLREATVFTSIVVDIVGKDCNKAYAYITDMGSNAVVVFDLSQQKTWRIEHPHFTFDPNAGVYKVGGIDFYWNDGVSSATLSKPGKDGHRELFLQPTSSTKMFKMSTKLLRTQDISTNDLADGVQVVGDRGPKSQSTACDFDPNTNVLFFTQVSKNGFGCWNMDRPFTAENTPVICSDCTLLEFPNDLKVDHDGEVWVLSDRQSRFLYDDMDFSQVNFRVLKAPAKLLIQHTTCEKSRGSFFKLSRK